MENTQEEQVNEQVEDTQDGNFNLTDELVSFNKGESPQESDVKNEAESDNNEKAVTQESKTEDVASWLIDNKFKDDDEGKQKLADSYKNLQSEYDKMRNTPQDLPKEAQDAIQFAEWVANNADAKNALEQVVNKPEQTQVELPEDFDQLEIYTEGTSSNEWYKATQAQNREQMKNQILNEVKGEFEQRDSKEKEENDARNMYAYLQAEHNMDDKEVTDYLDFIKQEENFSPQNLVQMYRTAKGIQPKTKTTTKHSESNPVQKDLPNGVNAAVAGGNNPPASNDPVEDLMKNLMGNSKTNVL